MSATRAPGHTASPTAAPGRAVRPKIAAGPAPSRALQLAGLVAAGLLIALALLSAFGPRLTADPAALVRQRTAAEHSIARGYERASRQLRDVRALTLAIPPAEADAIVSKARADLDGIRQAAVLGIAVASGATPAEAEAYARSVAPQLQGAQWEDEPGTLLAPPLFAAVVRTTDALQQVVDEATRQIARDPRSSPRPPPSGR